MLLKKTRLGSLSKICALFWDEFVTLSLEMSSWLSKDDRLFHLNVTKRRVTQRTRMSHDSNASRSLRHYRNRTNILIQMSRNRTPEWVVEMSSWHYRNMTNSFIQISRNVEWLDSGRTRKSRVFHASHSSWHYVNMAQKKNKSLIQMSRNAELHDA